STHLPPIQISLTFLCCPFAAVIVGGVVGALFAAFLVMLLIYRMKKKDEGSYTLEELKKPTILKRLVHF
uniref:Syndecan n=1 Tax=Laticauda laticaudata TaxID=8630 RepID=A0A8C5SVQ9_LATLA